MAGLTVVAEMIGMIGQAARLAASDLSKAADAADTYAAAMGGTTTSTMPSAGGNGGGMGASSGGGSGTAGMSGGGNQIATAIVTELQRRGGR